MSKLVVTDLDFNNVSRIFNLPDATADHHPVTFRQLNSAVEGVNWKDSVRVSTQGNISIASPGATIDGVTMVVNDRVLVRAQTSQPENGIYIWNGAAVPMTRSPDANTSAELEAAVTVLEEGTSAGVSFRQTQTNFTLGSGNVVWTVFGSSAAPASDTVAGVIEIATQAEVNAGTANNLAVTPQTLGAYTGFTRKFAQTIGDGTATQYTITHNLNTNDVHVSVYRVATGDDVIIDVERISVNAVRITSASAVATNSLRVVIVG